MIQKTLCFILVVLIIASCAEPEKEIIAKKPFDKVKITNQFVKANQQIVIKENDEMDFYQKSHKIPFTKMASGIRIHIYQTSNREDSIKTGDVITIKYTLSLLNGTVCYSSATDGNKQFKVGMQDVEDGLHKAVLYLKQGDKAILLIPSHLAHGLLGDSKKIPPQMPIVYDLEIVSVLKPQNN